MRLWLRMLTSMVAIAGVGLGVWGYFNRARFACRWASYRVGAAGSFAEARAEIAWFESAPNPKQKLRELVRRWGTGDPRFDLYVARYVGGPESPEAMRQAFSLEFGWHEERLPRWAQYWSWRAPQEPSREIASIVAYLDVLQTARPSKTITWREVLDLQAIFCLTGEPHLAKRLGPKNWRDRYRQWRARHPGQLSPFQRPETPFEDWQGPIVQPVARASSPRSA